jgi:uncharacterized protein YndB with AHSA1/START domain
MSDDRQDKQDKIVKSIDLRAPVARVWRALTDWREFGEWFRVKLEGPFEVGRVARGQILHPGFEHINWEARIERMEPERLFSYRWGQPKSHDKEFYPMDWSNEPTTLVEFRLEPTPEGTRLTVTESGFAAVPEDRRERNFRGNSGGWEQQMKNIEGYLAQKP